MWSATAVAHLCRVCQHDCSKLNSSLYSSRLTLILRSEKKTEDRTVFDRNFVFLFLARLGKSSEFHAVWNMRWYYRATICKRAAAGPIHSPLLDVRKCRSGMRTHGSRATKCDDCRANANCANDEQADFTTCCFNRPRWNDTCVWNFADIVGAMYCKSTRS